MNLWRFRHRFNKEILAKQDSLPNLSTREGWANQRVQNTLNLAVSCLKGTNEAYLEVGSFGGKSLEAALVGQEDTPAYSCDIEYQDSLRQVVEKYGVTFFQEDFSKFDISKIELPIGCYYNDGDHSYEATYDGLEKVIPILADKAIICIDDVSYVRVYNAIRDFVRAHAENFTIVHELWSDCDIFQSMTNHCLDSWYNSWSIIEYERNPERIPNKVDEDVLGSFHCSGGVVYPENWRHIWEEIIK